MSLRDYLFHEEPGITLYCGDCVEIMSLMPTDSSIEVVLADPPYSSGNLPESMKQKAPARLRGWQWEDKIMETDQLSTLGFIFLIRSMLLEARARMSEGASLLTFIDWRNWGNLVGAVESAGFRVNNMVVWDKQTFGMGNGFRNQHELILYGSLGTPRVIARDVANVLRAARVENSEHQSPKPESLINRLLSVTTDIGDRVIDPFAGAGTTLVAAKAMKRIGVGIEIEPKYCEIAVKRLRQEVLL